MIDTHCHVDLYKNPEKILSECQKDGITVFAMTNLPSHFEMGYPHVLPFKRVRLALGMHPLYAEHHAREFPLFIRNLNRTSYIGEIGLDFSREGHATKQIQILTFKKILSMVAREKKILSIHSRRAEKEVLELLIENDVKNAIFHWYSGPLHLIDKIANAGYFFSINPAMMTSDSGKKIINRIPDNKILTETDGPFTEINGNQSKPTDIRTVLNGLSLLKSKTALDMEFLVKANFDQL